MAGQRQNTPLRPQLVGQRARIEFGAVRPVEPDRAADEAAEQRSETPLDLGAPASPLLAAEGHALGDQAVACLAPPQENVGRVIHAPRPCASATASDRPSAGTCCRSPAGIRRRRGDFRAGDAAGLRRQVFVDGPAAHLRHQIEAAALGHQARDGGGGIAEIAEMTRRDRAGRDAGRHALGRHRASRYRCGRRTACISS